MAHAVVTKRGFAGLVSSSASALLGLPLHASSGEVASGARQVPGGLSSTAAPEAPSRNEATTQVGADGFQERLIGCCSE
jgi:hypothetical protein